jgi:hypothetical protein
MSLSRSYYYLAPSTLHGECSAEVLGTETD